MFEAKVINRMRCKYTRRVYEPGEVYRHESEARMVELASLDPPRVEWPPRPQLEIAGEPRHVGGGWYELNDGMRVRGRENAMRALRGER